MLWTGVKERPGKLQPSRLSAAIQLVQQQLNRPQAWAVWHLCRQAADVSNWFLAIRYPRCIVKHLILRKSNCLRTVIRTYFGSLFFENQFLVYSTCDEDVYKEQKISRKDVNGNFAILLHKWSSPCPVPYNTRFNQRGQRLWEIRRIKPVRDIFRCLAE